uniref:uncharacterized protein LOC112434287 n=1 Tax=Maylandia zebra TaxID=106582 RepID=UPI000D327A14|nr:uncharacterized protein LOC112434287 [Maylandia zebra]
MAGNRTRVNCLEGSYARHYTTIAHLQSRMVTRVLQVTADKVRIAGDEPPQLATPVSEHIQDEDGPYVKKPPNAFMLYLKEQRPKVIAELNIPGSAAVNAVVGQREAAVAPKNTAKATEAVEPIKGAAVDDSVTAEKISKDQPVAVTHPTFWERIQEQLRPERIRCLKTVKLPNSKVEKGNILMTPLEFYKSLMKRLCYIFTQG